MLQLAFDHATPLTTERYHYRQWLNLHYRNGGLAYASDALLFYAIELATQQPPNASYLYENRAMQHPAIVLLCSFWQQLLGGQSRFTAAVPYIQLFVGRAYYQPLLQAEKMPVLILDDHLAYDVQAASLVLGDHFLVTFLASHHNATYQEGACHYLTVKGQPLFKTVMADKTMPQLDLAQYMVMALAQFPKQFPHHWQMLRQKHQEV